MARRRRDERSRAGRLLVPGAVALAGCLLSLPFVLPDLSVPVGVEGAGRWALLYGVPGAVALALTAVAGWGARFVWWLLLVRTPVLLAVAVCAVLALKSGVAGQPGNVRAAAGGAAAGLAALVVHLGVRGWDRRRGARPLPGEVWLAMVPLREDPGRQLRHYCVVLDTGSGAARVAQITSKDKDGRRDHIRIPNDGWDRVSGRAHWVEIGREPRVVPYRKFLKSRPQGRCPADVWTQLQSRRPAAPPPPPRLKRLLTRLRS
ncbi:hypothetical protein ABZ924_33485 [Streptomyces sp. NPDC046876]|uniref:hypothetical protein n=1 Tax=Streptomyces sp. NPDC046876 TaxID=3155616 RepID=UPI00340D4463